MGKRAQVIGAAASALLVAAGWDCGAFVHWPNVGGVLGTIAAVFCLYAAVGPFPEKK